MTTRTGFRRALTGGVALAAASTIAFAGVALADEIDVTPVTDVTPEVTTGSAGSIEKLLPEDVLTVFTMIRSGDLDVAEVDSCVRVWFAEEVLEKNPFEIVIACVLGNLPEEATEIAEKNGVTGDIEVLEEEKAKNGDGDDTVTE